LFVGLYHHVIKVEPHRHGNLRAGDNLKLFRFPGIVCTATILSPLQLFFLLPFGTSVIFPLSLFPSARESRRHRPHPGRRPSRAAPAPQSATTPGIPRTPWSRRPVCLAITTIPKITLTPETGKPRKILPLISLAIILIF
jgi:hypothetical protein